MTVTKTTSSRLNKWEKEELLRIYKRNRADGRCNIVQRLTKEADELTKAIDRNIDKLRAEVKELESQKDNILSKNRLNTFDGSTAYTCKVTNLHPTLIIFDKQTDEGIQKLIYGDFEGNITE